MHVSLASKTTSCFKEKCKNYLIDACPTYTYIDLCYNEVKRNLAFPLITLLTHLLKRFHQHRYAKVIVLYLGVILSFFNDDIYILYHFECSSWFSGTFFYLPTNPFNTSVKVTHRFAWLRSG